MTKPMSFDDFISGDRTEFLKWTKDGTITLFFHPSSGCVSRHVHFLPILEDFDKDGKVVKRIVRRSYCYADGDCKVCDLLEYINDGQYYDDIVICVGDDKVRGGDLVGAEGYDWKNSIRYRREMLFGVVDIKDPTRVKILVATPSLQTKLRRMIREQIEDVGDAGNPMINPYPIKLTFDRSAAPADMYNVSRSMKLVNNEVIEKIKSLPPVNFGMAIKHIDKCDHNMIMKSIINPEFIDKYDVSPSVYLYNVDARVVDTPSGKKIEELIKCSNCGSDVNPADDNCSECGESIDYIPF